MVFSVLSFASYGWTTKDVVYVWQVEFLFFKVFPTIRTTFKFLKCKALPYKENTHNFCLDVHKKWNFRLIFIFNFLWQNAPELVNLKQSNLLVRPTFLCKSRTLYFSNFLIELNVHYFNVGYTKEKNDNKHENWKQWRHYISAIKEETNTTFKHHGNVWLVWGWM